MNPAQITVLITATISLAKKGYDLISAIKEKSSDRIKVELFLFAIILIIGVVLFIVVD